MDWYNYYVGLFLCFVVNQTTPSCIYFATMSGHRGSNLERISFTEADMTADINRYVATKLSRDSDYNCAESRTWILEVKLQTKI